MRSFWLTLFVSLLLTLHSSGHVVTQIYGEWRNGPNWEIEILFDAGYAVPEWGDDELTPAPTRNWLETMGESGWAPLRQETERYLREGLQISSQGELQNWTVQFIDFNSDPPSFPVLMNDGAYFRVLLRGENALPDDARIHWQDGKRPSLVLKLPGDASRYLTFAPGDEHPAPGMGEEMGRSSGVEAFRQGFLHVLPGGADHILFILGLFFYRRAWRPLLAQSLAFTFAHTMTLGLASAGFVSLPPIFVEPVIAFSLVIVALENLRKDNQRAEWKRLLIVFGFGLVHGLGFAGVLSTWIPQDEGFLTGLFCANLGVEIAQVALLAAAWMVTQPMIGRSWYPRFRIISCLLIAMSGVIWGVQRLG